MYIYKKLDKKYVWTILAVFVLGFIAHGIILVNKISFHDDIGSLFKIGTTWSSGRWGLGVIQILLENTIGIYSIPLWIGCVSLLFIALSACFLINLLEIKQTSFCILIGAIMTVFPTVTMTFLYMFTAGCYFLALFLTVFAIWLTEKYKYGFIGAVFCLAFGLGIYQAYFCVGVVTISLLFIKKCFRENNSELFKAMIRHGFVMGSSLLIYLLLVKLSLFLVGRNLSGYQGLNSMMSIAIKDRIKRLQYCYIDMWKLLFGDVGGLTENLIIRISIAVCFLISVFLFFFWSTKIVGWIKKILFFGLFITLPISINFIYPVSTDTTVVTALMRFSLVFVWIVPISFWDLKEINRMSRTFFLLKKLLVVCAICSILVYTHVDNVIYMKMSFLQEQTTAYYNVLISQIKGCEGYADEMPVVYIGMGNIDDKTFTQNGDYKINMSILDWDLANWVNDYTYLSYMSNHCGFTPKTLEVESLTNTAVLMKIDEMAVYPDSGSIQVVDNMILVKFSERE